MNRIEITFNSPKELEEYIKSELKTIPSYGYSRTSDKSVSIQAIYLQSIQIKKNIKQ